MDFKGQNLVDWLYQIIIVLAGAIGFVMGYIAQDFSITFKVTTGGLVLAVVVCVPNWPCFNRQGLKWQPATKENEDDKKKPAQKLSKVDLFEGEDDKKGGKAASKSKTKKKKAPRRT